MEGGVWLRPECIRPIPRGSSRWSSIYKRTYSFAFYLKKCQLNIILNNDFFCRRRTSKYFLKIADNDVWLVSGRIQVILKRSFHLKKIVSIDFCPIKAVDIDFCLQAKLNRILAKIFSKSTWRSPWRTSKYFLNIPGFKEFKELPSHYKTI